MNLRTFATVSAVAMFVLGGCVVVTSNGTGGGGSGGDGNTGNEGGSSTGGKGGAGGTGPGVGGGGGQGGAPACTMLCGDLAIDPTAVACPGSQAEKLWTTFAECACGTDMMGAGALCFDVCQDSACKSMTPSADCGTCLQDAAKGCGAQLSECTMQN